MSTANQWANVPCVSSRTFWSQPASQRASTFEELRQTAPVSFQEPPDFGMGEGRRGFWAITRHEDVMSVSRNPDLFCSGKGIGMGDTPADVLELTAALPLMDPPRLTTVRRVVSGAFTPKRVAQLKLRIDAQAARIVDEFVERGEGEVVQISRENFRSGRSQKCWAYPNPCGTSSRLWPRCCSPPRTTTLR